MTNRLFSAVVRGSLKQQQQQHRPCSRHRGLFHGLWNVCNPLFVVVLRTTTATTSFLLLSSSSCFGSNNLTGVVSAATATAGAGSTGDSSSSPWYQHHGAISNGGGTTSAFLLFPSSSHLNRHYHHNNSIQQRRMLFGDFGDEATASRQHRRRISGGRHNTIIIPTTTTTSSKRNHDFIVSSSKSLSSSSKSSSFRLYSSSSSQQPRDQSLKDEKQQQRRQQQQQRAVMTKDVLQISNQAIDAVNPYKAIRNQLQLVTKRKKNGTNDDTDWLLQVGGGRDGRGGGGGTDDDQDRRNLRHLEYNLKEYDEIQIVAFGKASSAMASAVVQQLQHYHHHHTITIDDVDSDDGDDKKIPPSSRLLPTTTTTRNLISGGIVICKDDHATNEEIDLLQKYNIDVKYASHPIPDDRSVHASAKLLELVRNRNKQGNKKRLIICCISGGGSALFCQPQSPLTLNDLQKVNEVLLQSGMSIKEMNVIRKKIETGKGGKLAMNAVRDGSGNNNNNSNNNNQLLALVLSDVLGDPLDLIASGPTVMDTSSYQDAYDIIERYQLTSTLPSSVVDLITSKCQEENDNDDDEKNKKKKMDDEDDFVVNKVFKDQCNTVLVGNNEIAVSAAANEASKLGYHPIILGTQIEGEAKEIASFYIGMAMYLQQQHGQGFSASPYAVADKLPVALIAGGETTVTIPADNEGKGGRNQELALSAAIQMNTLGLHNVVLASIGTDGTDGPTDAAGAVVDSTTVHGTIKQARKALSQHNAYVYFDEEIMSLDDNGNDESLQLPPPLVKTGPTGTNVADVCITLIHPAPGDGA